MTLQEERNKLFDENFNCKTTDPLEVVKFCDELKKITGIHTSNHLGMTYEYLPIVYKSALEELERKK